MNCPKCGAPLTGPFCANCGAGSGSSARSRGTVIILGVVAAALVAGFFALRSVLQIGASTQAPKLTVPASTQGGALVVERSAPPPAVMQPGARMPDDVRRWLEHLKAVDQKRENFNNDFASTIIGKLASLRPGAYLEESEADNDAARRADEANRVVAKVDGFFSELTADFQSMPPPAECRDIASQYSSVLLATRGFLTDVVNGIKSADVAALEKMQGTTYKRIDAGAADTNDKIDTICAKYQEPNKYSVFVDKGSATGVNVAANAMPSAEAMNDLVKRMLEEDMSGN